MLSKYYYKNWSLFFKVFSLALLILIPVLMIFWMEILPSVEEKILEEKKHNVKNTVEVAYGIVEHYYQSYKEGELTLEEAQEGAKRAVNDLRYETSEYFWINNYDLVMVMHPIDVTLNNTSIADKKDTDGKYLFREMVDIAKTKGEGFLQYHWHKPGNEKAILKLSFVKAFGEWEWVIGSGIYIEDIEEAVAEFSWSISLLLFALAGFAIVMGFWVARTISKPIKKLEAAAEKVSQGDVDTHVDIDSSDEVGKLAKSFNMMVNNIKKSLEDVKQKGEEAEKAAHEAKLAEQTANDQKQYLSENTKRILVEMEKFSEGDLTVSVKPENEHDDIGKLFIGFNAAVTKIRDIINNVVTAVKETANASSQISSSTEEMAAGAQQQSVQSSEVASAVEEMTKTITEMASNAALANDSSNQSSREAQVSSEIVVKSKAGFDKIILSSERTAKIISTLTERTNQIGEIIQVIDEIADQTNLLALNAAIEAARAGEEGRGFAVVADEVRKLAERTTKATKEIADTIKTVQDEAKEANNSMIEAKDAVEDGKKLNDEVDKSLQNIIEGIQNVNLQINQVAAASEQQSTVAEEISKNIESIANVTNESAMGIQQVAKASEDLYRLTENLEALTSQFKSSKQESGKSSLMDHEAHGGGEEESPFAHLTFGGNGFH